MTAQRVLLTGPDRGLEAALAERGATVDRVERTVREALVDAGGADATVFVITDVGSATAAVVAREVAPEARIVVYADGSIPDFARGVVDLIVDPDLMAVEAVAEELLADGRSPDG